MDEVKIEYFKEELSLKLEELRAVLGLPVSHIRAKAVRTTDFLNDAVIIQALRKLWTWTPDEEITFKRPHTWVDAFKARYWTTIEKLPGFIKRRIAEPEYVTYNLRASVILPQFYKICPHPEDLCKLNLVIPCWTKRDGLVVNRIGEEIDEAYLMANRTKTLKAMASMTGNNTRDTQHEIIVRGLARMQDYEVNWTPGLPYETAQELLRLMGMARALYPDAGNPS